MQGFDLEELFVKFRYPLLILLGGLILVSTGIIFLKTGFNFSGDKIEIITDKVATPGGQFNDRQLTVEIGGGVTAPGVYKLAIGSRINDLLILSGGFSVDADRSYTDIYIPKLNEQSQQLSAKIVLGDQTASSGFSSDNIEKVNINTASLSQLDSLPGIGPTYAQNIIEQRPYSNTTELVSKGAIKQSLYDKIKDKISIY